MEAKPCEFCGETECTSRLWGSWICGDPDCERWLSDKIEAEREYEHREVDQRYGF